MCIETGRAQSCTTGQIIIPRCTMDTLKFLVVMLSAVLCVSSAQDSFEVRAARVLRAVRLPRDRLRAVADLLSDVARVMEEHWPGSRVSPFGSILSGLGLWDSDVDCRVTFPGGANPRAMHETWAVLARDPHLFLRPTAVVGAKVPHVRVVHAPTNLPCDLSFQITSAVQNTALLKYLLHLDTRALNLATIIKYWAKVRKPTEETRIMSHYAMSLLVVFYLQQVNILPSVASLQRTPRQLVDDWPAGFQGTAFYSSNNSTLYDLLGGFFKYYDGFPFESKVVSVFAGTTFSKDAFEDAAAVPELFTLYKNRISDGRQRLNTSTVICIQEPFIHESNMAADVTPTAFAKLKSEVRLAADVFERGRHDLLDVIVGESVPCGTFRTCMVAEGMTGRTLLVLDDTSAASKDRWDL